MLNVKVTRSFGVVVTAEICPDSEAYASPRPADLENRNHWRHLESAQEVAIALTNRTGTLYIATDAGPYCSPRYDVIEAPKVGDAVSYEFNGDSYPCGHITAISSSLRRIVATEGNTRHVFWRRKETGAWIKDGTWFLRPGHVYKQNPSF